MTVENILANRNKRSKQLEKEVQKTRSKFLEMFKIPEDKREEVMPFLVLSPDVSGKIKVYATLEDEKNRKRFIPHETGEGISYHETEKDFDGDVCKVMKIIIKGDLNLEVNNSIETGEIGEENFYTVEIGMTNKVKLNDEDIATRSKGHYLLFIKDKTLERNDISGAAVLRYNDDSSMMKDAIGLVEEGICMAGFPQESGE